MQKISNEDLGRVSIEVYKSKKKLDIIVILDNIRSLHNIGSVFRTCDAFLVQKLYLCGICGTPPHQEIHKTALGAENSVAWEYESDVIKIIKSLKDDGYLICVVEQTDQSIMLQDVGIKTDNKYVLVFGNEVDGVQERILPYADMAVEIPQLGSKHSLNISVSAGIVMWAWVSKLGVFLP
ncbi:MAG: RNA methyltransferase [Cytophagales bacterium]|nr:RNA methyltransferase [Cytophagales bacterium]